MTTITLNLVSNTQKYSLTPLHLSHISIFIITPNLFVKKKPKQTNTAKTNVTVTIPTLNLASST